MEYITVTTFQSSVNQPLDALKLQAVPHCKNTKAKHVLNTEQSQHSSLILKSAVSLMYFLNYLCSAYPPLHRPLQCITTIQRDVIRNTPSHM